MYAVVDVQGHQYIVQKGTELSVDRLDTNGKKTITVDSVLLVFDEKGESVAVGGPTVKGATISFEVIEEIKKDKKIKITKFRRKNRYHRSIWFRAQKTVLKVKNIKLDG